VSSVTGKAFNSIQDRYPPATTHGGIISMTALVPEPILQAMAPGLVADFHATHPRITQGTFSDWTRVAYDIRKILIPKILINFRNSPNSCRTVKIQENG